MYWYKIVDKDSKGRFRTLFHGVAGNRQMPRGWWIRSEQKYVRDGSKGTPYKSGWHVMMNLDECEAYLSRFTAKDVERVIVKVDVKGKIWPKEHSPHNVHLSEYIKVIGEVE